MDWPDPELTLWGLVPEEERECHASFVHVLSRAAVEDQLWIRQVCSRHWCSPCEQLRSWRMEHRINKYMECHQPGTVWMITRSVRNDYSLQRAFDDLHEANRRFYLYCKRRRYNPWAPIYCWIATYEIKYDPFTGYNLHQHLLVGTRNEMLDYPALHDVWDTAAGYRAHLNFKPVWDFAGAARYISKYISKGCWGGLSRGRAYLVRETLKGRNRITTKHGTAVATDFPRFYLCCFPPDKMCHTGMGAWDPIPGEEGGE